MERLEKYSNFTDRLKAILEIIAINRSSLSISSEYSELMRLASGFEDPASFNATRQSLYWGLLPGLCCQAVGGEAAWADTFAAAWMLLFAAADIMDSVQDQDEPEAWWKELGPGVALSAATGLFFYASLLLNQIYSQKNSKHVASTIVDDFYRCFLNMSAGQYEDVIHSEPTIEQYWRVAYAKSGAFFEIACRTGARLGSEDPQKGENFGKFGEHIGVLIQILDDLEDLQTLYHSVSSLKIEKISRSLPVVYAMNVLPAPTRNRLHLCLKNAAGDKLCADQALQLLEQSGAVLYLLTEIERHRELALASLELAEPLQPAKDILLTLIPQPDSTYKE